ncbi:MAG: hypothetical protein G01um10143_356 [Parcubacteria group bacterium Gr01-1014_3]|nr:MAG: hypothetical protein G01um10143_356 [Parcubacteria group bacterium Gr01-1014_3]
MWEIENRLLAKLIELTKTDKMRWDANLDIHSAMHESNKLFVWWPQDGKPGLTLNDTRVEDYGIGIEVLITEIHKQYERQDRNGYGPTAKKEREEADSKGQEAARKEASDFANAASKFLEDENKKNKKRR